MIGVAHLKDVDGPGEDEPLDELVLLVGVHIIHRSEDILYLSEAGFSVGLLRPGKGTGDIGLVQDLERQVLG